MLLLPRRPHLGFAGYRLPFVHHQEVADDLLVQPEQPLELGQSLGDRRDVSHGVVPGHLLPYRVSQAAKSPVLDGFDPPTTYRGEGVKSLELRLGRVAADLRGEDVDDLVCPH